MTDQTFQNGTLPLEPMSETRAVKTYANSGSCRRAAKAFVTSEHGVAEPKRGEHFDMALNEDGSWRFWVLPKRAPQANPKTEVAKAKVAKKKLDQKVKDEVVGQSKTREEWLREGIERLHAEVFMPHLISQGVNVNLPRHRVACGFPLGARPYQKGSAKGKGRIGECWSSAHSSDGAIEMMVSPVLDQPTRVLGVLAHEMVHMYLGTEEGHGPRFRALATAIGLGGKMTATVEEQQFLDSVAPIIADMGEYPHAALEALAKKKDTVRQIKVQCTDEDCGCTFRLARKWIEAAAEAERGELSCPICQGEVEVTLPQ